MEDLLEQPFNEGLTKQGELAVAYFCTTCQRVVRTVNGPRLDRSVARKVCVIRSVDELIELRAQHIGDPLFRFAVPLDEMIRKAALERLDMRAKGVAQKVRRGRQRGRGKANAMQVA